MAGAHARGCGIRIIRAFRSQRAMSCARRLSVMERHRATGFTAMRSRPTSDPGFLRPVHLIKKAGRTLPPASELFYAVLRDAMDEISDTNL